MTLSPKSRAVRWATIAVDAITISTLSAGTAILLLMSMGEGVR
jgi:hypothetical protein